MLRSIFSLIQRIIDSSDKKYNNTKSKVVIYCFTNPDDALNMNLDMSGKQRKVLQTLDYCERKRIESKKERSFSIETEHGDVVTCKHQSDISIVPKSSKDELNRVTFTNTYEKRRDEDNRDADAEVQPNVQDLIRNLSKKRIEITSKGKDQISLLLEQIKKMKTGLERLQEIASQFNSSERFNDDINYLINNVRPHLQKNSQSDSDKANIFPKA